MDFNATIDLIIRELNEAREIIDDLKNYPGIPALQVELAKSKCKSAAEVIGLLKNLEDKVTVEKKDPTTQGTGKRDVTVKRTEESPKYEESGRKTEINHHSPESVRKDQARTTRKTSEPLIIADTFNNLTNRLNEQLGRHKDDNDVTERIKTKPITNLSDAIGVNDRFLFIRELFKGNPEAYEKAIFQLEQSQSFADARAIIMGYAGNDMENEVVKQLLDLVKRKFRINE